MRSLFTIVFVLGAAWAQQCPLGAEYNGNFNKCYLFVSSKNSFQLAEQYCYNIGGHLASIQNGYENTYLAEMSQRLAGWSFKNLWIGANDLNTYPNFAWTDGSNFTYTHWLAGGPQIDTEHQCVFMFPGSGNWEVSLCHDKNMFVCQFAPQL